MDSARIRLEATEAGWRELADELSHRISLVMKPLPAPPRRFWPMLALALSVLVVALLPVAIHRRMQPPVEAAQIVTPLPPPVAHIPATRPPPPSVKRHHKKKHR